MCGDLVKGSAVSNRSDERDNEVIAGVRKALAQPEPGDWGATLLDGWMESEGVAVRVVGRGESPGDASPDPRARGH
jgi:hypothetical protein